QLPSVVADVVGDTDVALDREILEQFDGLPCPHQAVSRAPMRRRSRQPRAADLDLAAARRETGDRVHEPRLSRTIRPAQAPARRELLMPRWQAVARSLRPTTTLADSDESCPRL